MTSRPEDPVPLRPTQVRAVLRNATLSCALMTGVVGAVLGTATGSWRQGLIAAAGLGTVGACAGAGYATLALLANEAQLQAARTPALDPEPRS